MVNSKAQAKNAAASGSAGGKGKSDKAYNDALKAAASATKKTSPVKFTRKVVELTDAQINALDGFGIPPSIIFRPEGWTRVELNEAFKKGTKYIKTWKSKQAAMDRSEEERPLSGTQIWYGTEKGISFGPNTTASEMYSNISKYMEHGEDCPRLWQVPIFVPCTWNGKCTFLKRYTLLLFLLSHNKTLITFCM
jgi:hypothetical protein